MLYNQQRKRNRYPCRNPPETPSAIYPLTIDYRAVKCAKVKNTWPIPHINTVFENDRGAGAFENVYSSLEYCKLAPKEEIMHLHTF